MSPLEGTQLVMIPMTHDVTIFWPDSVLADALSRAMVSAGLARAPRVEVSYPSIEDVKSGAGPPSKLTVVGLTEQTHALRVIATISEAFPDIVVAAADEAQGSETVIAAMRAGASEFLAPPFDLAPLTAILEKASAGGKRSGRLTSILPACGGSGASTIAVHLAHFLTSAADARVLLIDFDFQSGSIAFLLGLDHEFTLTDALGRIDILDEIWDKLACRREGFEVLAAPKAFRTVPLESLRRLPELFHSATRTYAHVLVDLPPGMFSASEYVLSRSDDIYLVVKPEVVALHVAQRRVAEMLELGLSREKIHIVVNRCDASQALQGESIEKVVGLPIGHTLSNDYQGVSAAAVGGTLLKRETRLGRELLSLARHVAGTPAPRPPSRGWMNLLRF